MLTPEEWDSIKLFAMAKNVLCCYLPLAFSDYPVLVTNSLAGVRIRSAGDLARREDSGHAGFQIFVDFDTPINREPSSLGQSHGRPHAYT